MIFVACAEYAPSVARAERAVVSGGHASRRYRTFQPFVTRSQRFLRDRAHPCGAEVGRRSNRPTIRPRTNFANRLLPFPRFHRRPNWPIINALPEVFGDHASPFCVPAPGVARAPRCCVLDADPSRLSTARREGDPAQGADRDRRRCFSTRARPGSGGARVDRPHRSRSRAQGTERRRGAHCGRHLRASATCSACPTPRSPSRCEGWIARSAGRFPDRAVRRPQSRSHDLPVEGDRRAAADARDFGVRRNRRRHPQLGTGGSRHGSTPGDPGIDLACIRGVGAALNPL
jgi:hypothetical protein